MGYFITSETHPSNTISGIISRAPKLVARRESSQVRGSRYDNPSIGRWTSRDPIGEKGGYNIYVSVMNNGISVVDFNGTWNILPGPPSGGWNTQAIPPSAQPIPTPPQGGQSAPSPSLPAWLPCIGPVQQAYNACLGKNQAFCHCYLGCVIAEKCGSFVGLSAGVLWEIVQDRKRGQSVNHGKHLLT